MSQLAAGTRTVYYTATTLDGFLADERDSLDWLFVQDQDEDGPLSYRAFIAGVGALAMGATTYTWIRDHLARTQEPWAYTMPTYVFSHREHEPIEGADVRVVSGPVSQVYDDLAAAAAGKDVWVVGGGGLAAQFAEAGHLDRMLVSIAGVTLGRGRPLFPRRWDLRLVEVARNRSFVCATYDVLGPLSGD